MATLFKAQQFIGNDNQHDPKGLKKIITDNWERGVVISFFKKDGVLRKMTVKLNEQLLAPKSETPANGVETRRATNKANGNLVVTEWLPETNNWQIRTVSLKAIATIDSLD